MTSVTGALRDRRRLALLAVPILLGAARVRSDRLPLAAGELEPALPR